MKISREEGGVVRVTLDQPPATEMVFVNGAEERLAWNTYGFEIEFCSHDNPVFTFTHVEVMKIFICGFGEWRIESDSGGVLELVTTPLKFRAPGPARDFKLALGKVLADSVFPLPIPRSTLPVIFLTLGVWRERIHGKLQELVNKLIEAGDLQATSTFDEPRRYVMTTWDDIEPQISVENVDDGINIPAARARLHLNRDEWDRYVAETVLCRSDKDWEQGYSSQANVPMTLEGYFLYTTAKMLQSDDRHRDMTRRPIPRQTSDASIQKNFDTWFWRCSIWRAFRQMAAVFSGSGILPRIESEEWDLQRAKRMGLLYIVTSKILTGALGALSEPYQLELQELAFAKQSTEAMVFRNPHQEAVEMPGSDASWLEFHSSMKDLTGLWFKGTLVDVIRDFGNAERPSPELVLHLRLALKELPEIWRNCLRYAQEEESRFYEQVAKQRTNFYSDLNRNWEMLLTRIGRVCKALDEFLIQWSAMPAEELSDPWRKWSRLPAQRADRPFLGYLSAPPWEGRYDTMYPPFKYERDGAVLTSYLVEHRFN